MIIGQGGAIRATAGLVGRGACLISGKKIFAASYGGADGGWETNPTCYTMPEALKRFVGRKVWEAAGGTWMGHDIASAQKFRASALFQKYEAEALRAVVERVRGRRRRRHRPGVRQHEGTGLHRARLRPRLTPSCARRWPSSIGRWPRISR